MNIFKTKMSTTRKVTLLIMSWFFFTGSHAFATVWHLLDAENIVVWSQGPRFAGVTPLQPQNENCTDPAEYWFHHSLTNEEKDRLYKSILMGKLLKKQISLRITGCTNNGAHIGITDVVLY